MLVPDIEDGDGRISDICFGRIAALDGDRRLCE
jgi:hypothetical protein